MSEPNITDAITADIVTSLAHLLRDDATLGQLRAAATKVATGLVELAGAAQQAADTIEAMEALPDEWAKGQHVHHRADMDHGVPGVITQVIATDGEVHTVRVQWPENTGVLSHHPSELVHVKGDSDA